MAGGKPKALDRPCTDLYAIKPELKRQFGFMLGPADGANLAPELEARLATLESERARRLILYYFNMCARRFTSQRHRRNVMQRMLTLMVRRFGSTVVPEVVSGSLGAPSDGVAR